MTEAFKFPLLTFFITLKNNGFYLGIDDYISFYKTIHTGFGLDSEQDLMEVCIILWLKERKRKQQFEELFKEAFKNEKKSLQQIAGENIHNIEPTQADETEKGGTHIKNRAHSDKVEKDKNIPDAFQEKERHGENTIYLSLGESETNTIAFEKQNLKEQFHFIFSEKNFFPLANRQLQIQWRNLRRNDFKPDFESIDVDRCVEDICENLFLTRLYYQSKKKNKTQLVTIIDHEDSMTPFKWLSKQIVETVSAELDNYVFYCNNMPVPVLFTDISHNDPISWEIFYQKELAGKMVLIISDAGAIKGNYNSRRIENTKKMITQIKRLARGIVWLNPMPISRWKGNSAMLISDFVPMFECTHIGITQTIQVLKKSL